MSGAWWKGQLIVGPFANIAEANAWAAANPGALFVGLLCTVSGVQYTWQGAAEGGWVAQIRTTLQKLGTVGRKRISGSFNNLNSQSSTTSTTQESWLVVMCADAAFDGFRIVFPGVTGAVDSSLYALRIKCVTSIADAYVATGWTDIGMPALKAQNASVFNAGLRFCFSDYLDYPSVPRADGNSRPMVAIEVFFDTGKSRTLLQYAAIGSGHAMSIWETNPPNGDYLLCKRTTGINTAPNDGWQSVYQYPIVGCDFYYRTPVVNVMRIGDSKLHGAGTYQKYGFVGPSLSALSNGQILFSDENLACPGLDATTFLSGATKYLRTADYTDGFPDVIVVESASPNDNPYNSAKLSIQSRRLSELMQAAKTRGIRVIVTNFSPCNTTVHDWTGGFDALRIAYNSSMAQIIDFDWSSVTSGVTVSGQVQIKAGYTDDGIHENDAGIAALTSAFTPVLQASAGV